jgi:alpha-ketoglutarate-dependent taurine dioxygenase
VYDEPSPPDAAPQLTSVQIPLTLPGTTYADGVRALRLLTEARDRAATLLDELTP